MLPKKSATKEMSEIYRSVSNNIICIAAPIINVSMWKFKVHPDS